MITHIKKPATIINVAYFTMILIGALWLSLHYEMTHANSAEYTIKICTKTMWWVNYLEGRKSKCNLIWLRESYIALNTNN